MPISEAYIIVLEISYVWTLKFILTIFSFVVR